ncbi:putative bifunctional diguanylate cyclase/phosphodiesterase [Angustibacter sp. McL0619]|uniref:putative bifunctional diguanylate cyclase/phosphodiesterase n=1 Tax=Angustibacter sp. McL0619 TaxID=3415676 RepID=UPI003CF7E849
MRTDQRRPASVGRVFASFAAIMLVVVAAMGVLLGTSLRSGAEDRALSAARVRAQIIAASAIEPALDGHPAAADLAPTTIRALTTVTDQLTAESQVLRLRVRSPQGRVVFSDDGSGFTGEIDDEALEAAEGHVEAHLTRLNADDDDTGAVGPRAVEVYEPLHAGGSVIGVLELYVPYAPIAAEVQAGYKRLYRDLTIGLVALYLVLLGLTLTTTRRLRQSARGNAYLADHDPLTDLPNRRAFLRDLDEVAQDATQDGGAVAVIDMARFKTVNDSLGHHNGDALLLALGVRLRAAAGRDDLLARLGGDEFGIVLPTVRDDATAERVLRRVLRELGAPLLLSGIAIEPEASAGFAMIGVDGADATALLRRADIALSTAKARGAGVVRFDPEQDHYDPERLAMVGELGRAMAMDELVLHFQPKVCLDTGALVGAEALLRWQHPRHGLLYPDAFLPLAEQTGLIDPLTEWVLDHALGQVRSLGLPKHARMSVNISARNLGQQQFATRVLDALGRRGIESSRLVLELTETAVFADVQRATAVLEELSAAGVAISLDDFGQGQTSIGHLANLHVRELKIDRAYVRDMLTDDRHAAIVRSLIELAHNLALTVVAEGIEDDETREALRELGCDEGQGYGLARPMPAAAMIEWIKRHEVEQALR